MSEWLGVHEAARLAKCVPYTIRKHDRKGNIESKIDQDNKRRKLYLREDVENLELKGRLTVKERMEKRKKSRKEDNNE